MMGRSNEKSLMMTKSIIISPNSIDARVKALRTICFSFIYKYIVSILFLIHIDKTLLSDES